MIKIRLNGEEATYMNKTHLNSHKRDPFFTTPKQTKRPPRSSPHDRLKH
jgi:hypothetical protein